MNTDMEHFYNDFKLLVCGEITEDMFEYGIITQNLSYKIGKLTKLIINYNWDSGNANVDIPFYCRNILESCLTAILGRLDPFRLIMVYKVQADSSYDLGKRAQIAVEWTGDIIAKNSSNGELWRFDKKRDSFDRALLGNYIGDIVWKPAFAAISDYIAETDYTSQWLNDIASQDEVSCFERCKATAMRLFSSFSKGVHSECLIDINNIMDDVTLKNLIKDLYNLCSTLALASHFVGFMSSGIDKNYAIEKFLSIEEMINNV